MGWGLGTVDAWQGSKKYAAGFLCVGVAGSLKNGEVDCYVGERRRWSEGW